METRWLRRVGWAIVLLACSSGHAAAFADCSEDGYLRTIDDRLPEGQLDCMEIERFTISTPKGARNVRVVRLPEFSRAGLPAMRREARRGVEASAQALRGLGSLAPPDMTIWLSHLLPEGEEEEELGAAIEASDGCLIVLYPAVASPRELAHTAAHEFFHCVQQAEFENDRAIERNWWLEGSAEWFADLALPGTSHSADFIAEFDERSPNVPLTRMKYDSLVFFFWFSGIYGAPSVADLLHSLSSVNDEAAQQRVLAAALSPAEWQRFAEDYLARAIRYPDGRPLPSRPFTGDIYEWIDSFEHVIQARPFVLARATLEFSCGLWGLTAAMSPETTRFQDEGGSWGPLPDRLAVADGEARQLQMAGFASGPDGFRVAVTGSKNPCQACSEATSATDVEHCLIGRWELLAGGYGEQVERDLSAIFQSVQYPDLHRYLHLEASGVYRQLPGEGGERGAVTDLSPGGKLWAGRYRLSYETQGQWSAEGDRLTLCETGRSVRSDATIIDPDGSEELIRFGGRGWNPNPQPFPYRRQLQCSDDSLVLKEGAVTWHYRRTE